MGNKIKIVLTALSLVALFAFTALAQETTGGLQGTVKDPQGAVVPGASITITGITAGYNRTITADENGYFRVQELPPGDYRVTVTATGFSMQPATVRVAVGKEVEVPLSLAVAGNTATVNVNGADNQVVVDPTDNTVQTNIGSRLIDQVPKGVSFDSLLRLDPGVRSEPLSGGFQVDGASGAENNFMINGQEVNNFRHGTLNANNAIPNQVISEVQIKTSGFEAEFGGASGGVVSVVTKSGTNDWHGEFGTQFNTSKLNAGNRPSYYLYRNAASQPFNFTYTNPKSNYVNFFPTANIGGPIVKNRVWFFGSYSPQMFETNSDISYYNQSVTGNTLNLTPSAPTATSPWLVPTEQYRARTRYEYALARIDAQASNTLRFTGSFLWNPEIDQGGIPCSTFCIGSRPSVVYGGQRYSGAEATNSQGGRVNSNNTTLQAIWTPTSKFFMNFRYGHNFLNDKPASYGYFGQEGFLCSSSGNPQNYNSGCTRGFRNIPASSNFLTNKNVSRRDTWNIDASYQANFVGRHQLKAGFEHGKVFSDIDEGYVGGITTLYYGIPVTALTGTFGGTVSATPGNFGSGILTNYGERATGSNSWETIYAQDNWTTPIKGLTLNLGLRAEKENLPAFNTATGQGGQAFSFSFKDKLMPRVGFAYDVFGDGRTKVFGSYGLFMDRLRFELPVGSFGGAYYRVDYFELLGADQSFSSFTQPRIIGTYTQHTGGTCTLTMAGSLFRCELDYRIPSK
ncbi:MAG: carboxypeptidase regulatory-like domain-containing protein, partial [Pyrinomonadaceae bacterium]